MSGALKGDVNGAAQAPSAGAAAMLTVASGALFGFGLALSGMVRPEVVLSFLLGRDWGLMLVMGGALAVTLAAYQGLPRWRDAPWLGGRFEAHTARWQRDTVVGAALFGVGWGLSGVCPGPAIAGLGTGNADLLWALAGMAAGGWLHGVWAARAPGARGAVQDG